MHAGARLLAPLGTMLSFAEPDGGDVSQLPDTDLGRVLLLRKDVPDMTPGDVSFKIGSTEMISMYQSHCTTPGNPASTLVSGRTNSDEGQVAFLRLLDRHRYANHVLFEMVREYGNFWGDAPFPYYIKDHKLFFPSVEAARAYMRKGWRFLSENHIPRPTDTTTTPISRTELYRKVATHPCIIQYTTHITGHTL
jgi:hypothetical protein